MVHEDVDVSPERKKALDALSLLSRKWQPVVIVVLAEHGECGFNDLNEAIPDISGKVLSDTLEALGDAGLVERTVVSESPLRVEYRLTDAGANLDSVFETLADWRETHIESITPTVLIAEKDRRLTEMYSNWLNNRYTVLRAHNSEQVDAKLTDEVDIVLFAGQVPGVEPAKVPDVAPEHCRSVLLVDDQPAVDVLEIDCDHLLSKPIVRETALDVIETQLARRGESEREREYNALRRKQELLERTRAEGQLETDPDYRELCERIERLDDQMPEE